MLGKKNSENIKEKKYLSKKVKRLEKRLLKLGEEIHRLSNIEPYSAISTKSNKITSIHEIQSLRVVCLSVVLTGVSYRSVPKILNFFNNHFSLGLPFIPHFTSIINWSSRLGLGLLKMVKPIVESWVAIIDHSINFGTMKALIVLRVPTDVLALKGKAIQLSDCECIGIKISDIVNGESIALDLEEIFKNAGSPIAIIKDCDSTLKKGCRLFLENTKQDIQMIEDIGHVTGNALKSQFENTRRFKLFTSLTTAAANKLRQIDLAFAIPPKLRTKGRFQSISKLGNWSKKILEIFAQAGKVQKGSQIEKLKKILPGFMGFKPFIESFFQATNITAQIMEILKSKGLNQETYTISIELLNGLPKLSKVKIKLTTWLDKHFQIQKVILCKTLPVSSDIIESLFGIYKRVNERNPHSEMNRSTLLIPVLCGVLNESKIIQALALASQKDINEWVKANIPYTIAQKRREFFMQNDGQKWGQEKIA